MFKLFARFRRWLLVVAIIATGVLGFSGRWTDSWLWTYIAVWAAVSFYGVMLLDDDLARERFHPPSVGADPVALRVVRLSAFAHLIVGSLDVGRWHVAPVPPSLRALSLAALAVTALLVFRAMHTNHFFSGVVRIQHDRGHHVVDRGPYAVVRHPGYAGMIPMVPFSGLALGSWLAVAVGLLYSVMVVRRVLMEDDFLKTNLQGYREYAERVRYRLLPGVF